MKFLYQYRNSKNELKEGVVYAASRDAAYTTLKKSGIKPSRVEEAAGFFNKLFGKGKRWLAIAVLSVIAIAVTLFWRESLEVHQAQQAAGYASMDRHQIYGEPALMAELDRNDYSNVFPEEGDRFLAHFAQPGIEVKFSDPHWRKRMAESLANLDKSNISFTEGERREVRELKRIVKGMREELSAYLSNGVGTCATFVRRLEERQTREMQIVTQAKNELARENDIDAYERWNVQLRRMGLPTISVPENGNDFFHAAP